MLRLKMFLLSSMINLRLEIISLIVAIIYLLIMYDFPIYYSCRRQTYTYTYVRWHLLTQNYSSLCIYSGYLRIFFLYDTSTFKIHKKCLKQNPFARKNYLKIDTLPLKNSQKIRTFLNIVKMQ